MHNLDLVEFDEMYKFFYNVLVNQTDFSVRNRIAIIKGVSNEVVDQIRDQVVDQIRDQLDDLRNDLRNDLQKDQHNG
jgi:phosphoserine phosphatase